VAGLSVPAPSEPTGLAERLFPKDVTPAAAAKAPTHTKKKPPSNSSDGPGLRSA
jgi:hypothetical protein